MWIFSMGAVITGAVLLAKKSKEDICDTLPVILSVAIGLMYILAFFRALPLIDFLGLAFLCALVLVYLLKYRGQYRLSLKQLRSSAWEPRLFGMLIVLLLITFLVKDRIAVWWDDINYWACDAKALYFLQGFTDKYGNVAPEFGDYPPAIQLIKWWFLHISDTFCEGLMFAGYYCMNMIFLFPLVRRFKGKGLIFSTIACGIIFLIPGIADWFSYKGTCADVTMGIVYGAMLWAVWDRKNHSRIFYFSRITAYACVLVLTKSVGMEWVVYGILFMLLLHHRWMSDEILAEKKKDRICLVISMGVIFLTEISWLLFCLMRRRVAKLTGAGVKIATGGHFSLPDNTYEKWIYFFEGFSILPLHEGRTLVIDCSAGFLLLFFVFVIFVLWKKEKISRLEKKKLMIFTGVTAILAYGIIFLGHLTIFAGELQYLDATQMKNSLARYAAPFTIGMIYLLMAIILESCSIKKGILVCASFTLLTANYPGAFYALYGYQSALQADTEKRSSMIDPDGRIFIQKMDGQEQYYGKRTLYLRDDLVTHWVKDTYISYEVSPQAVVYSGISDRMSFNEIEQKIRDSHAEFLYVDPVLKEENQALNSMCGEPFSYGTMYQITEEQGRIRLIRQGQS